MYIIMEEDCFMLWGVIFLIEGKFVLLIFYRVWALWNLWRRTFSCDQLVSFFLQKIFGNKMFPTSMVQTFKKYRFRDTVTVYGGFPFFSAVSTFTSVANLQFYMLLERSLLNEYKCIYIVGSNLQIKKSVIKPA